jgi:hypothetical protein
VRIFTQFSQAQKNGVNAQINIHYNGGYSDFIGMSPPNVRKPEAMPVKY